MSKGTHAEMRRIGRRKLRGPSHALAPEGKRSPRPKATIETRSEVDEGAAAWAYRRRAQAPVCDPPCEECINEMEDDV